MNRKTSGLHHRLQMEQRAHWEWKSGTPDIGGHCRVLARSIDLAPMHMDTGIWVPWLPFPVGPLSSVAYDEAKMFFYSWSDNRSNQGVCLCLDANGPRLDTSLVIIFLHPAATISAPPLTDVFSSWCDLWIGQLIHRLRHPDSPRTRQLVNVCSHSEEMGIFGLDSFSSESPLTVPIQPCWLITLFRITWQTLLPI